jgi:peptidoglycan L-alanyl-D-glutamate endopeptidase CwlK
MTLSVVAEQRLSTVNPVLRDIVMEAEKIVPFMVLEGHRGKEAQDKAVAEGKSKLPWPQGKHNKLPSDAVDLAPLYFEAGAKIDWNDLIAFGRIMGVIQALAFQRGVKLRFGLDWDGDFRSVNRDPNESFLDAPHVEVVS